MADTKITGLLTPQVTTNPATDVLPIVNIADTLMAASGSTRKITVNQLLGAGGTATLASATITGAASAAGLSVTGSTIPTNGVYLPSANNLGFAYNSTLGMTLNSTGLGVGVSPSYKLDIGGTGSQQFRIQMSGQADTRVISDTGAGIIGTYSNHQLIIRSNSITAITVDTSQNVGIGVVPGYKLDVNGTGKASSGWGVGDSSGNLSGTFINESDVSKSLTINADPGNVGANSLMQFKIDGSTRLLIDSSGNVGIGVTPSASWTGGGIIQQQNGAVYANSSLGSYDFSYNSIRTASNSYVYAASSLAAARFQLRDGAFNFFTAPSSGVGGAGTAITFTPTMTLDASGNLLVGTTTSTVNNNGYRVINDGNTNSARLELGSASSTNSNIGLSMYSTGAAAYRFYVGWGGTVFATNTTISAISDQRLKENVQDIDVGLGAILALKPRKFDWKAGKGKDIKGDRGFIAQEFEQVFPNLIDEWKDAAPEGEAPYKSVRQDLIPVLVKAIQELTARVQTLETR